MPAIDESSIEVSRKGQVPQDALDRAVEKVVHVAERAREPITHVEVRLSVESAAHHERPASAEATLNVEGAPVRAHISAPTVDEAVDALTDRLKRRLDRHEDRRHHLDHRRHQTGEATPGQWRHGDHAADRPPFADVPVEDREVRKHKTLASGAMTFDEAAWDLIQLDHAFYLYEDIDTGSDRLAVRRGDEVGIEDGPPHLTLAEAKSQLEISGAPFLFHLSGDPERGRVLYRRYDGHYGLLSSE